MSQLAENTAARIRKEVSYDAQKDGKIFWFSSGAWSSQAVFSQEFG